MSKQSSISLSTVQQEFPSLKKVLSSAGEERAFYMANKLLK